MPDLLFEIGCEELPPSAVASGESQLREEIVRTLEGARLRHGAIETFATPRRLAVLVRDLTERQESATEERRGPPVAQGIMTDGDFSPAAVGFARANGVEPSQLVRRQTEQGEYLFAVRELAGADAREVLPPRLSAVIEALAFPKSMRWDASKVRFPRPVRWLVALFGDEVLPLSWGELNAGRASNGHRVFHPAPVEIARPSAYADALRAAGVIARRDERREMVRAGAIDAARAIGGRPVLHDAVLNEVTDLVEHPSALAGRFEERYLEIPRDVLITAMETHQRYFAVEDDEGKLLAGFVVVTNGNPESEAIIVAGNERVLRARLEDARFFFEEDQKVSLVARTEQLGGVVFHAQLGTMRDKVLRVGALLGEAVRWLGLPDEDADAAFFAADLCKADLLTHLVYEFPELQGIVGREYALRDKELVEQAGPLLPRIADAVRDHYLPRFAEDDLPASAAGMALGLADRLDTLVGYMGLGLAPTGSEDPFGLRRQATGFAAVSLRSNARLPLDEAIAAAREQYAGQGVELQDGTEPVRELIVGRAEATLEREGVWRMFVDSARRSRWDDLPDMAARARALQALQEAGMLHPLAVAHERCFNLSKGGPWGDVDEGAFVHDSERNLYAQLQAVEEIAAERAAKRDYAGTLETLAALSEVVVAFFDGVLVMDPDESLKRNRLALLERTAAVFALVADFSVVIPAELEAGRIRGPGVEA